MGFHTWKTTLTVRTSDESLRDIREWLDEHAPPVPSRDDDALAKYLRCVILSNSEWDGVSLTLDLPRPSLHEPPQVAGCEWDELADCSFSNQPRSRLALAVDGCAALMVLACIGLIASHAISRWPPVPLAWYNAPHAVVAFLTSKTAP
jgi:hypothetical protein